MEWNCLVMGNKYIAERVF